MHQLVKFVAVLLFGVFVLSTPVAYAVPQDASLSNSDSTERIVIENSDPALFSTGLYAQTKTRLPDGSYRTEHEIKPSVKGATEGAKAGAAGGRAICTSAGVTAPLAPVCAFVGSAVGGITGFVFGPADRGA